MTMEITEFLPPKVKKERQIKEKSIKEIISQLKVLCFSKGSIELERRREIVRR
jgi:hypothetical protein